MAKIQLPTDPLAMDLSRKVAPDGEYYLEVSAVSGAHPAKGQSKAPVIDVTFKITGSNPVDDGKGSTFDPNGLSLFKTFVLDANSKGFFFTAQLLQAAKVTVVKEGAGVTFDTDELVGKIVKAKIGVRELKDGSYGNELGRIILATPAK